MIQKTALVTGGTRGIGLAIRKRLVNEGYKVLYTGTKNNKDKDFIQLDLENSLSIEKFLKKVEKINIDILIVNSGINIIKNFLEFKHSEMMKIFNINFLNNLKIIQIILRKMIKKKFGRIVLISSIWGVEPSKKRSIYSITKKSLQILCENLASETSQKNILINSISPGFIETELTKKSLGEKKIEKLKKRIPLRRLGKPEEIAELAFYLVNKNTYINGQNITIDGGFLGAIKV